MPPCAAADEVRGRNLATAELNACTLSTTGFDQRNASCPRRQKLARLGGGELLLLRRAAEAEPRFGTLMSLQEVSQPHASSLQDGDITPEFSGRRIRPRSEHFIHIGPAATNKREFPFTGNTASSAKIDVSSIQSEPNEGELL